MASNPGANVGCGRCSMGTLIARLLRPYRGWLAIILLAMVLETAMSLAAPWPLKIILDNVVEGRPVPQWLAHLASWLPGDHLMRNAAFAGIATVLIAAIGALASYLDNYFTESVGQWVANDLRVAVYDHLEHLPLAYYDTHQTLMRRYPNYQYLALSTREADTGGQKVYIQDLIASGQLEDRLGEKLNPARTHVFLCGNPKMIGVPVKNKETGLREYPQPLGVIEILEGRGFQADNATAKVKGNVHFEEYW